MDLRQISTTLYQNQLHFMNIKRFRLKNLQPFTRNSTQQNDKRSRLVGVLTDVLKNIISQTDDQPSFQTIGDAKSLKVKTEHIHNPDKPQNQHKDNKLCQIIITNKSQIEDSNTSSLFKQHLDARDYVLAHPFSFKLTLPQILIGHQEVQNDKAKEESEKKRFSQTAYYSELCDMMNDFIVTVCQNVISIGFRFLNSQNLLQNQAKDFASKNILLNIKSAISSIMQALMKHKIAENSNELQQIKYNLTKTADQTLLQVLKNLADYYPQATPTGGTPKMRSILAAVNRMDDNEYDFIFAHDIRVTKNEIQTHDYTEFIMKVLNKAIQVTGEIEENDVRGRTLFEKYTQFCQNLFGMTQHKQNYSDKFVFKKDQSSNQKDIAKYLQGIVLGFDTKKSQNLTQTLIHDNTNIQKLLENTNDQIQKLKQNKRFSIGQKIPSFVKSFSNNDLKEKNINAKNSSILRILTKWAEYLQQIFDQPDIIIKQRIYPFKTTENQPVNSYRNIKDTIYQNLMRSKQEVKSQLAKLQNDNTVFQAEFLSKASNQKINSFVKRFSDTRETASKMNAVMIRYMLKYINILIDKLIMAGKQIYIDFQEKTINLVSFRIGDLMRARLQCSESGFINILKSLYALDKLDNHRLFKLVRIKNKLDSKDNNILINFMFMGKTQCELQLSIQNLGGKEKNYYSFSHFIYELTRGKFGALTQCAIIISQHDPKVSSNRGYFYKPKRKSKQQNNNPKEKMEDVSEKARNIITNANDKKMFICRECGELIFNENIDLLTRKGNQNESFFICVSCSLKMGKKQNKTNEELINDQQIAAFLKKWVEKQVLLKLSKYDLNQCHNLLNQRQIFLLRFDPTSANPQLCYVWQYTNKSTYYLLKLNASIPELTTDEKISQCVDYKDISKQVLTKAPTDQFTYIVYNFTNSQFRQELYSILKITHECIDVSNIFNYFLREQSKAKVIQNFKSKNQILTVFQDRIQINEVEKYFQAKNQDQTSIKKQYIKRVYANYLQLSETPAFLNNWSHLKVLNLANNRLDNLNLAQKIELSQLYLSRNNLKTIKIQNNKKLEIIYIGNNRLEEIKVDHLHKLRILSLSQNNLQEINVENNVLLTELNLIANQLKEINLRNNQQLSILYLASNKIQILDLQNNTKLTKFNIYNNKIAKVDLGNMPDLFWIRMAANKLTSVDLSNNKKLVYLDLSSNNYESINLRNLNSLQNVNFSLSQEAKIQNIILDGLNAKCQISCGCHANILVQLRRKYPSLQFY